MDEGGCPWEKEDEEKEIGDCPTQKEPRGMRKYEPLLAQLQWEHGAIYIPLPVPARVLSSSNENSITNTTNNNNNEEEKDANASNETHSFNAISASCERVRMVLDMLDIRWTHFLTYSYGALVAARMAATPVSSSSMLFPRSPLAPPVAASSSSSTTSTTEPLVSPYAHRVGTILLLDTPLVTQAFVDNFFRRQEWYLGAQDGNVPSSALQTLKQQIQTHLEGPLPTPCAADKTFYERYLFAPHFTFPTSPSCFLSKQVEGMTNEHDEVIRQVMEEAEEGEKKEEEEGTGKLPHKNYGLFRRDERYIPFADFWKNFGHPMELITPAEGAVAEVEVFKKMFATSRRTAVIKSAKPWWREDQEGNRVEEEKKQGGKKKGKGVEVPGGKQEKKSPNTGVPSSTPRPESLLFECIERERAMAGTRSGSSSSSLRNEKETRNTAASTSVEGTVPQAKGGMSSSPTDPKEAGPGSTSKDTSSAEKGASSTEGSPVLGELCQVIRSWMRRYEPDVYISQQFLQRAAEMKQLLEASSSTGGELAKKGKEQTKEKKKKEKKSKK